MKRRSSTKESKCKQCGSTFHPSRDTQVYCSGRCRTKYHVENNREKHNATVRKYRRKRYEQEGRWMDESPKAKAVRVWINELKSAPCTDCGNTFPTPCMDFDHKEGTTKEYNVGSMVAHHYARELIEMEVSKCEVVCSNCHRLRTQKRRTGSGLRKPYAPRV